MTGYLLDTNIVSFWFKSASPEHAEVARRVQALPDGTPLTVSAITLGEIEYGHRVAGNDIDRDKEAQFLEFVERRLPVKLSVESHTRVAYGALRAGLFRRFSPLERRRRNRWPEELIDPTTAKALGVQENDLWIASQALEHNLVLVSHDGGMARLREVEPDLRMEDWAAGA